MLYQLKLYLLMAALFAILYAFVSMIAALAGIGGFLFYGFIAGLMLLVQYLIGPAIIDRAMGVQYVSEDEHQDLHMMVAELAQRSGIPKPRVGISRIDIPNAFAFGRSLGDGRIAVTRGIMKLLSKDELKAVLGHEVSHLKHRDVLVVTTLSVVPMIAWYIYQSMMWSAWFGGNSRQRGGAGAAVLIGMFAFLVYFITNLLILYASRTRESYADYESVKLGNRPHHLASALYRLVYGSARASDETLKQVEGVRALFLTDPARARTEISQLREIDSDMSGKIDMNELLALRSKRIKLGLADRLMEMFTTHPNTLRRIKNLSELAF